MSRLSDLRARQVEDEDTILRLAEFETLTDRQQADYERARGNLHELEALEARKTRHTGIAGKRYREYPGVPGDSDDRQPLSEVRSATLRRLEAERQLSASAGDRVDYLVRDGNDQLARELEVHSRPEYSSAFGKIVAAGEPGLASAWMTDAERAALHDSYEVRSQVEGTTTLGGFAVPIFLDPSVILTDQEADNPFLRICRVVDVDTNVWKGVSAAGVSWSFDAETAQVSDDSITLAQPSVGVYMARGFIPYSIEVSQDWPGFSQELARLLAIGYDELLLSKFTTGNGTTEPRGVITALDANTNDEVTAVTSGQFGVEDVYKIWAALPQKARRRASWMLSVSAMNRIRAFGTANLYHALTVTLPEGAIDKLMERPVYENPYFPDLTSLSVGVQNRVVVGDWSNYVVARRAGLTVETVPHLMGSNDQPRGMRGVFAFGRVGGNSVNDLGFRLGINT